MAKIQEATCGAETERIRALFTCEEEESRDWKAWLSNFLDRTLCRAGASYNYLSCDRLVKGNLSIDACHSLEQADVVWTASL